jgi:lipopolysaccharide export system permease protein
LTFALNSFVIPKTSINRIEFLNKYHKDKKIKSAVNNQLMVEPGVVAIMYRFETRTNTGTNFALERYNGKKLASRLTADKAEYKGDYLWHLTRWNIRDINDDGETLTSGAKMDTIIAIAPEDIIFQDSDCEKMTTPELSAYIDKQRARGTGNIQKFEIEYHERFAAIATSFILTLIGVCLSSKKIRGGMGINLGIGLALTFLYIMFQTVSSSFAVSGDMPVIAAVWLPNIVFLLIATYLYKYKAPR